MKPKIFENLVTEDVAIDFVEYCYYGERLTRILWLNLADKQFEATNDYGFGYKNYYQKAVEGESAVPPTYVRVGHYKLPSVHDVIEDIAFVKSEYRMT